MGRRRWCTAAALSALAALLPVAGAVGQPVDPGGAGSSGLAPHDASPRALEPSLRDDLAHGRPVDPAHEAGPTPGAPASRSVTVVVEADRTEHAARAVSEAGGRTTVELDGVVQADVPAAALGRLARARGITYVSEPHMARPVVTSEGVATTGAAAWQTAGQTGAGTKVAIVDVGFAGYSALEGTELPAVNETDFSRCGGTPGGIEHGTAVAEIVHDMAPDATLRLICIETNLEFIDALQTLPSDVRIVNGSIGFLGTGRGDGSGSLTTTPAGAIRMLRRSGVLYVAAAGNYGGRHWHGKATGDGQSASYPTATDYLNHFDDAFVDITADDAYGVAVEAGGTAQVVLQWDSWSATSRLDFDLFVFDQNGGLLTYSNGDQAGNGSGGTTVPPVEAVQFTNNTAQAKTFFVRIDRWYGTAAPRFDLYVDANAAIAVEAATTSNLPEPASSAAAFSAGAYCHSTGALEPYSSQGPTIDGRIKPDIAAPDGTSGVTYGLTQPSCQGGFTGTSASAPHLAGAAALLLAANPALDVAELQQLLMERATDAGPTGKDNQFGTGRLTLGVPGDAEPPVPQPFTAVAPVRLFDTRGGQGAAEPVNRTTPVGAGFGAMLTIQVRDIAGIPADATAVVLNVAVTSPTDPSYVTVQPGQTKPTTANLSFVAGQTFAQHVTVAVAPDDKIRIYNNTGSVHVIVDLGGWYGPTGVGGPGAGLFTTLRAPTRAFDSRADTGFAETPARNAPLAPNEVVTLPLGAVLPDDATGAVLTVTVANATSAGYLVVYPGGTTAPGTSTVNVAAGKTVPNLSVVGVGAAKDVQVKWVSQGTANVVVDVVGYYATTTGAGYVPLPAPVRQLDTRSGIGPRLGALGPAAVYGQETGRYYGVPGDASAVMLAVTAVNPTAGGYLTVYPTGTTRPVAASVNFSKGGVHINAVVTGLGTTARAATFFNSSGTTHVLSDIAGYFLVP